MIPIKLERKTANFLSPLQTLAQGSLDPSKIELAYSLRFWLILTFSGSGSGDQEGRCGGEVASEEGGEGGGERGK